MKKLLAAKLALFFAVCAMAGWTLAANVDRGTAWLVYGSGSYSESAAGFNLRSAHVVGGGANATAAVYQASGVGVLSLGNVLLNTNGEGWLVASNDIYSLNAAGGSATFAIQGAGTNNGSAVLFTILTTPVSYNRVPLTGGTGTLTVASAFRLNSVVYSNVSPASATGSLWVITGGIATNLLSSTIAIAGGTGTYVETNPAAYYAANDVFFTVMGTGSVSVASFASTPP